MPTPQRLLIFKRTIWSHYAKHKRPMPWRDNTSLYYVVVSEVMLQQTQVSRVLNKFETFVKRFPDFRSLAQARTRDVLKEWKGLGYNRRALYLKEVAENYVQTFGHNRSRQTSKSLHFSQLKWLEATRLPGLGPNTVGAIKAYTFNTPSVFVETNIRSAIIHFFYKNSKAKIHDEDIVPILSHLLKDPRIGRNPREWYWALMDYGSYLKKEFPNPSRKSAHHTRQKPFKGSNREARSHILELIMRKPTQFIEIARHVGEKNLEKNLADLTREGFLNEKGGRYRIAV